jgi:hypothetical protein
VAGADAADITIAAAGGQRRRFLFCEVQLVVNDDRRVHIAITVVFEMTKTILLRAADYRKRETTITSPAKERKEKTIHARTIRVRRLILRSAALFMLNVMQELFDRPRMPAFDDLSWSLTQAFADEAERSYLQLTKRKALWIRDDHRTVRNPQF